MPRLVVAVSILALTSWAGPVQAQGAHPLVGAWNVSIPAGTRIENGVPSVIRGTGKLTVELVGDSLVVLLAVDPVEGMPARPPVRFAAKAGPGAVEFIHRSSAHININGNEQDAVSISTWSLSATGDALTGSVSRRVEGFEMPSAGPQPVSGTRVR